MSFYHSTRSCLFASFHPVLMGNTANKVAFEYYNLHAYNHHNDYPLWPTSSPLQSCTIEDNKCRGNNRNMVEAALYQSLCQEFNKSPLDTAKMGVLLQTVMVRTIPRMS